MVPVLCLLYNQEKNVMTTESFGSSRFTATSKAVAQRFLQSVVALDDLAWMGAGQESMEEQPTALQNAPNFGAGQITNTELGNDSSSSLEMATDLGHQSPDTADLRSGDARSLPLNSKLLIGGFANLGLVCSVFNHSQEELEQGEISASGVVKAAKRADIVILDWRIGDSYGNVALKILGEIITGDIVGPRLRLVAIYSGEPGLPGILSQVKTFLNGFYHECPIEEPEPYVVSKGPIRVAIVPKPESNAPEITAVAEKDLADHLINEFVAMTKGLLRNVALEGLAALRDHVPKVLTKFDSSLDPAYIGHRILLPNPSDAEEHIVEALGAELLSILEGSRPSDMASIDNIKAWLDEKLQADEIDIESPTRISGETGTLEMRLDLIEKGIDKVTDPEPGRNKLREMAAAMYSKDAEAAKISNLEFAALLGLKTHYPTTAPKLTLGTVLRRKRKTGDWRYFMCLQPKCDAVRLKGSTGFPFLHLSISADSSRFGCVILSPEGDLVYLDIDDTPSKLLVLSFTPNSDFGGEVIASQSSGGFWFLDVKGDEFEWVAALKDEHALDVADKVAKKLARPGPNHSEWLRRAHQAR